MRHKWTYFIDASTKRTGITLLRDDEKKILITDIDFSKAKIPNNLSRIEVQIVKFNYIKEKLDLFIKKYPPDKRIYMEGIFVKSAFLNSSEVLLKFHGFLILYFIKHDIKYIPPKTIKKVVTGNGNAKKEEVKKKLEENYKLRFNNLDQSDSFALFICYKCQERIEIEFRDMKVI